MSGEKKLEKKCKFCGRGFIPKRYWQRFCSSKCRWRYWERNHPRISIEEYEELNKLRKKINESR